MIFDALKAIPIIDKWVTKAVEAFKAKQLEIHVEQSNEVLDETGKEVAKSNGTETPPDPAVIKARRDELNRR